MRVITEYKDCRSSSNNGKGRCGSQAASGDLPSEICDQVKSHPWYSEEAHHHYARMHVAVAPDCNIQCNYCNRKYDCANESHPGVVGEKLTPEHAARKLVAVATTIPQLTVLGIAGPGEALASPKTTLRLLNSLPGRRRTSSCVYQRTGWTCLIMSTRYPAANRPRHHHHDLSRKSMPGYILGVSSTTNATPESKLRNESPLANCEVSRCSRKGASCARSIQR